MAANYRIRQPEVVARQHHGAMLTVIHAHRGELHARDGDWLVGPENARRGEVDVLTNDEFNRLYEPIPELNCAPGKFIQATQPTDPIVITKAQRKAKE